MPERIRLFLLSPQRLDASCSIFFSYCTGGTFVGDQRRDHVHLVFNDSDLFRITHFVSNVTWVITFTWHKNIFSHHRSLFASHFTNAMITQ